MICVNSVQREKSHPCKMSPMSIDDQNQPLGPRGGKTTVSKAGLMRVVVYLHPDERKALKLAAVEEDCTGSDIMRRALRAYLEIED